MQISSTFCVLLFFIVSLTLCVPYAAFAQQVPEHAKAIARASRDVSLDIDTRLWFAVGCMLGPAGVLGAYVLPGATPPTSRFIGKSPQYVALYRDTYKAEILKAQSKSAIDGCLTAGGISAALIVYWLLER